MKINDLDFMETADDDLDPSNFGSDESFLRAVRAAAHAMCGGDIPTEHSLRLGLLFSAVAKLAITSEQAVSELRTTLPQSELELMHKKANFTMAGLCAAAATWAEVVLEESNNFASLGD